MASLQETNQKLSETVTRLEKTPWVITASPPFSSPSLALLYQRIQKEELVESKGKDKDTPKVIVTPFKEKPIHRREPAFTFTPLD